MKPYLQNRTLRKREHLVCFRVKRWVARIWRKQKKKLIQRLLLDPGNMHKTACLAIRKYKLQRNVFDYTLRTLRSLHRTNMWVSNDKTTLKITPFCLCMCTDLCKFQLSRISEQNEKQTSKRQERTDRTLHHLIWLLSFWLQVTIKNKLDEWRKWFS